jgi:hypothetical protein
MKVKQILELLIAYLITLIPLYLLGSFISLSLDPSKWEAITRLVVGCIGIFFLWIFISNAPEYFEESDNNNPN